MRLPALALIALIAADPGVLPVRMDGEWLRRDWRECRDAARVEVAGGVVTFHTDRSAALLWQVPTRDGPAAIGRDEGWVERCSRPPIFFTRSMLRDLQVDRLVPLAAYPSLSWRWWVDAPLDDSRLADPGGRIRREADDFAAKIGVLIQSRDSNEVREVSYVWTRALPVDTVLYQESSVIPFRRDRMHRIVAESGTARAGSWVEENRDLAADFRRLHGEEPGHVVRLYLMSDADATQGRVTARFADVAFRAR